ncbi:MAG: sensor histidine kinase [Odoribacteraceae bacterium]|jgi:signal transduction histidine kinase|nr:sensor histidine kinase [Odoribacteraceae bacterium]
MFMQVIVYLSLLCQVIAAGYAAGLVRKTKFNVSWIMFSAGFFLVAVYRVFELFLLAGVELHTVRIWLSFVISLVFTVGIFYTRKLFQFLRRMEELRDETEKRVLSAVIHAEEQERSRFSKELHDGIGPLLSVAKMLLSGLDAPAAAGDEIKRNLRQVVDEAIDSVREISANISPRVLNDFGLEEAISSFIKKLSVAASIDIRFRGDTGGARFPYNVEVIMYRVTCELVNNTIRHAGASVARLRLYRDGDTLRLDYEDNGRGFDPTTVDAGTGLRNMRYRLKSGNGDILFTGAPGEGMKATAYIHAK